MKLIGLLGPLALLVVTTAAEADTLSCDAANKVIFTSTKTVMSSELSLNGLFTGLDIATDKKDADSIHQLLSDIKARCQKIIDAAKQAKDATDAISGLPDHCNTEQAQIDEIRSSMDKEIADCTGLIAEADKN